MQLLYQKTHWLRFWLQLESNDQNKEMIMLAWRKMEMAALQIHVWRFRQNICA
jgi:hypothetical protein